MSRILLRLAALAALTGGPAVSGACEGVSEARAEGKPALGEAARQSAVKVLGEYERLRAALAGDEIAAATGIAEALQRAAAEAEPKLPAALRPRLKKLAAAAERLKKMPKDDAASARRSFGEVSEATVALLAAEPSLRAGRLLFECPMAQGYKKWVQTSSRIENPYMGKKMLECGMKVDWEQS